MAITLPTLITTVWRGNPSSPTAGLLNNISQVASSPNASWADGFCAANMTPISAGGVPPFGGDMNGILNAITTQLQYINAGGQFPFSSALAAAIGGYQPGMIVQLASGLTSVVCTSANNMNNPNTNMTGWVPEGTYAPNGQILFGNAFGTGYTSTSNLAWSSNFGLATTVAYTGTGSGAPFYAANSTLNTTVTSTYLGWAAGLQGVSNFMGAFGGSASGNPGNLSLMGLYGQATTQHSAGSVQSAGLLGIARHAGAGSAVLYGVYAYAQNAGTGTATSCTGVYVGPCVGGTTSASNYGVYISGVTGGASATNYGLYIGGVNGGTGNIAICTSSGVVVLGDATQATLVSNGSVTLAGGIGVAKNVTVAGTNGATINFVAGTANASVACVFTASVGPTGANTAIQGWTTITINGVSHYQPYW